MVCLNANNHAQKYFTR